MKSYHQPYRVYYILERNGNESPIITRKTGVQINCQGWGMIVINANRSSKWSVTDYRSDLLIGFVWAQNSEEAYMAAKKMAEARWLDFSSKPRAQKRRAEAVQILTAQVLLIRRFVKDYDSLHKTPDPHWLIERDGKFLNREQADFIDDWTQARKYSLKEEAEYVADRMAIRYTLREVLV